MASITSAIRHMTIGLVAAFSLCTGTAQAQIVEGGFGASFQRTVNANNGSNTWTFGTVSYGAGTDAHGSSGVISHAYDVASNLLSVRNRIAELRNSGGPLVFINNPAQRNWGQVTVTPQFSTPYTISGAVTMVMSGNANSSSSATGSVIFEQVGGPTLATFGASMNRSTSISMVADLFDSAAPLSGSATGTLLAGVTYRLSWDFSVSSLINLDQGLIANIFGVSGDSYVQIAFVPTPGAAGLIVIAGVAAARRRR